MTILWIYNMPLIPEAGGTERITSLVAKGLSQRGHNCMGILVFNESDGSMTYDGKLVTDLYDFLKENNVDVVINQIAYSKWLLQAFLDNGGKQWRAEGGKIISCLHFDPCPASDLYYFITRRKRNLRKYLNITKAFLLKFYYNNRQKKIRGRIFNWIYDNSDWYITLSPTHFPYFKRVTKRDEYIKLISINNPLTFDSIADKSIIDRKKKVILVCSRMDEYQKRISLVLKTWSKLQNKNEAKGWSLKLLGTGPDLEEYIALAKKLNLHNISFEGRQSPERYYDEASIFLMTSIGIEGWGLTLTESLQQGVVPVVMNTCSVYNDIITHCYNGYLTKGSNLKIFTNYVLSLMEDEQRLRAMQLNALLSAERFTLDKTMQKWEQILNYETALENNGI